MLVESLQDAHSNDNAHAAVVAACLRDFTPTPSVRSIHASPSPALIAKCRRHDSALRMEQEEGQGDAAAVAQLQLLVEAFSPQPTASLHHEYIILSYIHSHHLQIVPRRCYYLLILHEGEEHEVLLTEDVASTCASSQAPSQCSPASPLHVHTALVQLHSIGIVHHDLKPEHCIPYQANDNAAKPEHCIPYNANGQAANGHSDACTPALHVQLIDFDLSVFHPPRDFHTNDGLVHELFGALSLSYGVDVILLGQAIREAHSAQIHLHEFRGWLHTAVQARTVLLA